MDSNLPRCPTMRTLIISEKDIAAKRIAEILSDGDADAEKMGGVNVYEWKEGKNLFTVVGLRGHIISLDYPKEHTRWSLAKLKDLIWAEPLKSVDKDAKPIGDALKKLSKDADRVIVATDYDREGELIGVEALDLVKKANKEIEIKRAHFSSLTKDEVKAAFNALKDVDYNLAASAEARQVVDLAWGATLTRFISLSSGQRGEDFLSVGRVQSPTLALIVDKEKEIRAFVPVPYWEVHATFRQENQDFPAQHKEGRFWEEPKARAVYDKIARETHGTVLSVDRQERTEQPPEPFNTTSFLRAATALGVSAGKAMSVAEELYTSGWISYPRTDNTVYPPTEDLRAILEKLAAPNTAWEKEAKAILAKGELKPTKGKKTATDHPPIHPVELARGTDLTADQWKIYELVVRRFLATLSEAAISESLRVTLDVAGEPFTANGRRLVKAGFRAVYAYHKGEDIILPALAEGNRVALRNSRVDAKMTTPPKRYSQGKLIQEMENLGLGTKSTRAEIIDKLYRRDYVRGTSPEPTETGFAVTDTLERYADTISKPQMTAKLEAEMDEIAAGDRELGTVVEDSRKMLDQILADLEKNRTQIGDEIRKALQAKNTVGECQKSKHPLIIRRSKAGKRFVGCSGWPECDQTYPLPQFGKILPERAICPTCSAPVIKVIQAKKRPWITCLTIGCRGVEELEQKAREERKAAKLAEAQGEDEEGAAAPAEPDPEDLGEAQAE